MASLLDQKPQEGIYDADGDSRPWLNSVEKDGDQSLDQSSATGDDDAEVKDSNAAESTSKNTSSGGAITKGLEDNFVKSVGGEAGIAVTIVGKLKNKKTGVGAGIAGVVIGGVVLLGINTPNLLVNHLKELLINKVSNVQIRQSRKYRQKYSSKLGNLLSKDGRIGQRIVNEMEKDGYTFSFEPGTNKIKGITNPSKDLSIIGDGIGDHMDAYMEKRHPLRSSRWKTARTEALYNKFGVKRSSVVASDKIRAGPNEKVDPKKIVNKGMAGDILDGEDTKISSPGSTEKDPKSKASRDATLAGIEDGEGQINDAFKEDKVSLIEKGTDLKDLPNASLTKAATEAGDAFTEDIAKVIENTAEKEALGSKLFSQFKSVANPTDILDKACTVRSRLSTIIKIERAARAVKLLRYLSVFTNLADDTRRGNANSKLVNEVMSRTTTTDKNGVGLGGSTGMAFLLKSKFSKSKNNAQKSAVSVDGELSGISGGVNNELSKVPGMNAGCPYVQNPAIQVTTGVVAAVGAFFSGGASEGVTAAFEEGFTVGVRAVIKEQIEQITVKQVGKDVLKNLAGALTFEGVMTLTEIQLHKSLNLPFTGQERGGQLGNILAAGAGVANKQRSLRAGMAPSTTQQYAMAQTEYLAWHKDEMKKLSFYDRMINTDNTDSLVFNVALATPSSPSVFLHDTARKSTTFISSFLNPKQFFNAIIGVLSPKALAETSDEVPFGEYTVKDGSSKGDVLATDPAGNPLVTYGSYINSIDPEKNQEYLISTGDIDPETHEPMSEAFKSHMELCVDTPDSYTSLENDKGDCLAKKEITQRFKAQLAYLDLADGIQAEFLPETIGETGTAITPGPNQNKNNTPVDGLTWPLAQSKAEVKSSIGKCLNETTKSICDAGHPYKAHDLFAKPGTQVYAVAKGTVISAKIGGCGHGFGSAFTVQVYDSEKDQTYFYQHMDPSSGGVASGTVVKPGDPIGKVGPSSAACNTSPHLHIDLSGGKGRAACSRLSCSAAVKAKFIDISQGLYKGYEVLN